MAKKINLAERISEMVNDDAARTYIREHTLYPAVLLSGTRIGLKKKCDTAAPIAGTSGRRPAVRRIGITKIILFVRSAMLQCLRGRKYPMKTKEKHFITSCCGTG